MTEAGERLNERGFAELRERITAGPVLMLNLLAFKSDGGAERYGEYAGRGAFLEMISSPEYLEIAHLRTEALARSELHPLDPAQAPIA